MINKNQEELFLADMFFNDFKNSMNMRSLSPWAYGALHGLVFVLAWGVPVLLHVFPQWGNITLGGLAVCLVNFLESKTAK